MHGGPTTTSLDAVSAQQVRVAIAPLSSLTELLVEGLGTPMGSPERWPRSVIGALRDDDVALLAPVYGPSGPLIVPDCLTPCPVGPSQTIGEELDRVAQIDPDDLVEELEAEHADTSGWATAMRSPRCWLDAYVAALRRAWEGLRPHWRQAAPQLDREVERVGTSLVRGAFAPLIAGVSPRGRVEGDKWHLLDDHPPAVLAPGLVLQPMLAGPAARLVGFRRDGAVHHLAYSLPGGHRAGLDPATPERTGLAGLLGEPRAALLQRLDSPVSAGDLARAMLFTPSAITHHLVALEKAGLVRRERDGRRVMVSRTARGTAVLDLYDN